MEDAVRAGEGVAPCGTPTPASWLIVSHRVSIKRSRSVMLPRQTSPGEEVLDVLPAPGREVIDDDDVVVLC